MAETPQEIPSGSDNAIGDNVIDRTIDGHLAGLTNDPQPNDPPSAAVAGSGSRVWAGVQLPDSGGPIEQAWQQTQPEPLRPLDGSVWDGPPLPDAGGPVPQAGRQAGTVTPRALGPGMRSR